MEPQSTSMPIPENEKLIILDSITIDCVIFGFKNEELEVLLVKHADGISKDKWGLPGGWIYENEGIDQAANRLLLELTGIKDVYLEQLRAFGAPDRFPLSRVITVGYYALIKEEDYDLKAGYTAAEVAWFKVSEVKDLIYDHQQILEIGQKRLRRRIRQEPIGFNLLPEKFTLLQLMHLYEQILGYEMDKPNFRRKILKMDLLTPLAEKQKDVSHRAAKLYRFNPDTYKKLLENGFNFEF
ncbi:MULTISPECIES: NUDIX domain-containing protein [unclassified Leeuwenhoekiella]|uniref:NUDIX hydrolase n=1 Tax=unclassified Leeuwenhoekiella TaxID=2615029 RepID=UPI000C55326E|nr:MULTISPECIES: NUDIX domain-containing protein [unclassified Leeuwenhoekiella]MAW93763.1 NUDIX hydrolase [Leeuwenhoekiella sp.]MBA80537.1 NUDIX hydrolase [Leeuwenhoekiella sp.]|tara:strand:+ start:24669 stop:25388 length:720 start_codon:yes stop_codon:yes gene_type:complete